MSGEIVGIDGTGEQTEESRLRELSFLAQNVLIYVLNPDRPTYSREDPREGWRMEICGGALVFLNDAREGRECVLNQNLFPQYLPKTRAYGLFLQAFHLSEQQRGGEEGEKDLGLVLENLEKGLQELKDGKPLDQGLDELKNFFKALDELARRKLSRPKEAVNIVA